MCVRVCVYMNVMYECIYIIHVCVYVYGGQVITVTLINDFDTNSNCVRVQKISLPGHVYVRTVSVCVCAVVDFEGVTCIQHSNTVTSLTPQCLMLSRWGGGGEEMRWGWMRVREGGGQGMNRWRKGEGGRADDGDCEGNGGIKCERNIKEKEGNERGKL